MRADLHSHSNASDGTQPPADVMQRAAAAGLDVIALTDHDTVAGLRRAAAALPPGLTLVPGMELSCRLEGHSVHLLAYLFDPGNDELAGEMAEIRESRLYRARAMVDKLVGLGVPITWDQVSEIAAGGVVGRPHVARALVEAGVVPTVADAFTPEWIGPGGRAHVPRYALDPARAVRLVSAAGGVSVLAHARGAERGWRTPDEVIEELADAGLTGLEIFHPQHNERERAALGELATRLNLVASGGSDDHGELTGYRIGTVLAPDGAYEQLAERATGAVPIATG
ncbi:MAG TPA: PHP domain-containing protein [Streptosporangiaceae bacterium]|jgi:predicted metal-dependent phosphoesterase TrpH|nr:PHP domain-containing protein [Streptosporangiaceae bacterium]